MPMPGIEVKEVRIENISHLADVLARAFNADPVMTWATREDERRLDALRDLYEFSMKGDLKWGWETTTTDLQACAIWTPPESMQEKESPIWPLNLLPRYIRWCGVGKLGRWFRFLEICDEKRPKTPHYYLDFIGVHPDKQGLGYASALLSHTLAKIDKLGELAYLESSNSRNNPLYQRYGFEITDEIQLSNGPKMWCMLRKPRNNATCNALVK